jgi:threonine synthase
MEENRAHIHYIDGTYEDAVLYSSEMAKQNNWYDANPGMNGTRDITLEAYSQISYEIYRSLKKAPDYIFCPVGNGSTLAGIHLGFKKLFSDGKIKQLPRIVAVSTKRGNPIIKSFKEHKKVIQDLNPNDIHETKINEPLINWHSFDGQEALDAIYESKGFGEYASDSMMIHFSKVLREDEGLLVHPASSSTLAVLAKMTNNNIPLKGTFVVILSARNV